MDEIRIIPTAEEYIDRFHAAVDVVSRERRYLVFVEAPPLESMRAFVRRLLDGGGVGVQMLAVTKGDAVVGWCDIVRKPWESVRHVGTLGMGLLPDYRGRGLGERLALETIRGAWAAGIERVELEVFASNERAIALYRKLGFVTEGVKRRSRKLDGQYDDNVLMALLTAPSLPRIRSAQSIDAGAAVHVMRRSIMELCVADHQNDSATLELWLQNKTVDRFLVWLAHSDNHTVVADSGAEIIGIGMIDRTGEVLLCYVLPGREHRGVGRAILTALENRAREWGIDRLHLLSTATAQRFYEGAGYVSCGEPQPSSGIALGYPYEKRLPIQG